MPLAAPLNLRLMTDIVGFDLTHVYLSLDVMDRRPEDGEARQRQSLLKLTLPECHLFLKALKDFRGPEGSIEVTTPVLEESKRPQGAKPGVTGRVLEGQSRLKDLPRNEGATGESGQAAKLGDIIEKLNVKAAAPQGR